MNSLFNIDAILSDPLLLVGIIFVFLGPLVFLIALIKFFKSPAAPRKQSEDFLIPIEHPVEQEKEEPLEPPKLVPHREPAKSSATPVEEELSQALAASAAAAAPTPAARVESAADKTVVMPAGMSDVQAQLEIIFSQIKTMNKKLYEIESGLHSVSKQTATTLDASHDNEPPMNPSDFTQKLLKLAEHVIVLEKEVARLKAGSKPATKPESDQPKPPIMPI